VSPSCRGNAELLPSILDKLAAINPSPSPRDYHFQQGTCNFAGNPPTHLLKTHANHFPSFTVGKQPSRHCSPPQAQKGPRTVPDFYIYKTSFSHSTPSSITFSSSDSWSINYPPPFRASISIASLLPYHYHSASASTLIRQSTLCLPPLRSSLLLHQDYSHRGGRGSAPLAKAIVCLLTGVLLS